MDDEVMTDDEQDYLADKGTLSIELNDANVATSSGISERFSNRTAKSSVLAAMLPESLNQNITEDGPASMNQFSILHDDDDDDDDIDDSRNDAGDSKMSYQSSMNNNVDNGQSVTQNGQDRNEKFCTQENNLPKVSSERKEQEKGEKEKRRGSREEPEDGEILEDGEIASEEDDLFFGKRPRDDDEYSEKSASSQEESEMKSEASDNEVENIEAEKPEAISRRERRKRKRERREKRRKKNESKRKRKRLEYVDHDQVNDEYSWNLSSKNRSPSGPYDSPSDKQSSSPYRSPPGPYDNLYESPPGLYDSPSEDDDDGNCPKLANLIGDNFMDLAVAATEKEDIFQPREKKRGGKKSKRSHHHHSSKKKPLLETPRQRTMCKFFKEGKCSKADDCPYSHDFKPSKKTEICKFYLNSICTKGDNCLFLHGEYPCKFYHTGAQCYQGEKCKFSHEPLNDETKILLEKILEHRDEESSDDDSSREDGSNGKRIPSLFDIKVYPPGQSPKKSAGSSGSQSVRPGFYKDSLSSSPSGNSSCSMPPSGSGMGGLGQLRPNIGSPGHPSFLGPRQTPSDCPTQQQSPPQHGCSPPHPQPSGPPGTNYPDDNISQPQDNLHHPLYHPMHYHHHHGPLPDERHNSEGDKVEERKPVPIEIPSHLPPKQKELFLRIQQQQHLQTTTETTEIKNDMKVDDDNWYSSDEDEDGEAKPKLADILKNLNQQPPKPPPSNFSPSHSNNQGSGTQGANSALNIMQMINAIRSQPTPTSGGPSPAVSGGATITSTNTATTTTTAGSAIVPGSSGASSVALRRDPRLQAQKGNVPTEQKAMSSPAPKADPRLQSGKATTSIPSETVPPRLPTPPVPVINAIPTGELPYRLYEVSTNKLPLSATVDVFDPRFKNDPRVQKFLSNPPECLKQKAGSLETDKMLKSLGVPNSNRIDDISNTAIQTPTLPAMPVPAGLPPVLQRPQDPRLQRTGAQNSRILGKKSDDKDSQELSKPIDPRLMRSGNDQKSLDPRLSRQQSNTGNIRNHDPRLSRQQDAKNPPSRLSGDPRAVRQQSPVREPTLPTLLLPPLPNVNAQSGNSSNSRGPRPPSDQTKFGTRGSIPPNRPNNPRSMRPENQNKNIDQNESQNTDSAQPKLDHRNDPRFKRKPAADSNSSQLPPPIRKFIGQRKGSMEYSSPLGVEMDKPEQSSGYNSYNRPPNANRQIGSGNKPRTSGADIIPPNLPPLTGSLPLPPVSSESLQSDPREMGGLSELSGVPTSGFPPQISQTSPNLPYQAMPPPDQPKLKDLFKTIDPTASPFC